MEYMQNIFCPGRLSVAICCAPHPSRPLRSIKTPLATNTTAYQFTLLSWPHLAEGLPTPVHISQSSTQLATAPAWPPRRLAVTQPRSFPPKLRARGCETPAVTHCTAQRYRVTPQGGERGNSGMFSHWTQRLGSRCGGWIYNITNVRSWLVLGFYNCKS